MTISLTRATVIYENRSLYAVKRLFEVEILASASQGRAGALIFSGRPDPTWEVHRTPRFRLQRPAEVPNRRPGPARAQPGGGRFELAPQGQEVAFQAENPLQLIVNAGGFPTFLRILDDLRNWYLNSAAYFRVPDLFVPPEPTIRPVPYVGRATALQVIRG